MFVINVLVDAHSLSSPVIDRSVNNFIMKLITHFITDLWHFCTSVSTGERLSRIFPDFWSKFRTGERSYFHEQLNQYKFYSYNSIHQFYIWDMYIERNLRSLTGIPKRRVRSNGSETIKQSLVKWMICKNVRYYLFHFSLFALKLKVSPERLEGGRGEVGGICVSRY